MSRSTQGGKTGAEEYSQNQTQTEANADQRVTLGGRLHLRFDGRFHREQFENRFGSTRSDFERRTGQAGVSLGFHPKGGNFFLSALGSDQNTAGDGIDVARQERGQFQGSSDYRHGRLRLNASGLFTTSRREPVSGDPLKDRELSGTLGAKSAIPLLGDLDYRFTGFENRNLNLGSTSTQSTHTIGFSSTTRFAGGRGLATLNTTSGYFTTTQTWRTRESGERLRLPHAASLLLDDTPEVSDPLEGESTPVPEVIDGNRQAATAIQIGDSAPAVREFGGDFRNIQFDFGEEVDIVSAILYVDGVLLVPQMVRWRVFVSNDPEGRIWEDVTDAQVVYGEWGTGLQGWTVALPRTISARYFKMVDVKLGPTVPDLSVTELEVFAHEDEIRDKDRSTTTNHRANASLAYQITPTLRASYEVYYRRRLLDGSSDVLEDRNHAFIGSWIRGSWSVSGRYELRTLEGRSERNTDVNGQTVMIRRGSSDTFATLLSWARNDDRSAGIDRTSNSASLGYSWPAAPSLRLDQRVTGARLNGDAGDLRSTSLALLTRITAEVVPGLTVDLEQNERWVSQEAGVGFSRFEDTSLSVGWRPAPLIGLQSSVRYQMRDQGDWLTRNSITWDPLTEGDFKLGFGAHHYRDTRASETQRGGGVRFEWEARPSLAFAGSVEAVRLEASSQKNAPINSELKGTWRF